jgi:hypothetical protein
VLSVASCSKHFFSVSILLIGASSKNGGPALVFDELGPPYCCYAASEKKLQALEQIDILDLKIEGKIRDGARASAGLATSHIGTGRSKGSPSMIGLKRRSNCGDDDHAAVDIVTT